MQSKLNIAIVTGNAMMTKFMQAADMFEPWKVLGKLTNIVVTLDEVPTDEQLQKLQDTIKQGFEKDKERVSFVYIVDCEGRDHTIEPYVDLSVKAISNGEQWGMFDENLRKYGLVVETDNYRALKSVKTPYRIHNERGVTLATELGTLNKES